MSNGYKIHFVTMDFFIDCYKLTFTCYFVLFPIEFYLLKNCTCAFCLTCSLIDRCQVVTDTSIKCFKVCLGAF